MKKIIMEIRKEAERGEYSNIKVQNMTIFKAQLIHMRYYKLYSAKEIAKKCETTDRIVESWFAKRATTPKIKQIELLENMFFKRMDDKFLEMKNPEEQKNKKTR